MGVTINFENKEPLLEVREFENIYHNHQIRLTGILNSQQLRYWRQQIHVIAASADVQALNDEIKTIKQLDIRLLNALTVFSENSLHVLLEYAKPLPICTLQISNGDTSRTCNIIPNEHPNIVECVKSLVNAGVNINHINFWNETPILIALKYRYWNTVKYLLNQPDLDLDTCKDRHRGKTAREILKDNVFDADVLHLKNYNPQKVESQLFTYLKSNDQEAFLQYNDGNIQKYVDCFDGEDDFYSCGTLLQLCFRKAFIAYKLSGDTEAVNNDIFKTKMLKTFRSKGLVKSIWHLLDNGADFRRTNRTFPMNVIETATIRGFYPFLALLLYHKRSNITVDDIFGLITLLYNDAATFVGYKNYTLLVLLYKLEMLKVERKVCSPILSPLLQRLQINSEAYSKTIILGASVVGPYGICKADVSVLQEYLDNIVDNKDFVDYDGLVEDSIDSYSECSAIYALSVDPKKQELLLHPAILCLVHSKWKWNHMQRYFFIYLGFYLGLWATTYIHIACLVSHGVNKVTTTILFIFAAVDGCKEALEWSFNPKEYRKDISNYMDIVVIGCLIITIVFECLWSVVLVMLLSSACVIILLGQFPSLTKYMLIFGTSTYFFKYICFYLIQFLSFAACFAVVFPSKNGSIKDLVEWTFHAFIFFTGEFNDDVLNSETFPVLGRLLLVGFIFCMTLILNNLLVGLIVTDMDRLHKTGKLYREVKVIKFLKTMELLLNRINSWKILKPMRINWLFRNANVFEPGQSKKLHLNSCPSAYEDNEELERMKQTCENSGKNIMLPALYEHIITETNDIANTTNKFKNITSRLDLMEANISEILKTLSGKKMEL